MKKSVFSIGLLTLGLISIKSQTLTYVGKTAEVYVKPSTLVYSGGTVEVKDTGVIENQGNIKIDNGGFSTESQSGSGVKLKSNSSSSYGQLWIENTDQTQITGNLTKECVAINEGAYQHIALPFDNKLFSTLSTELGKTFSDKRWSLDEILVSRNSMVRTDVVKLTQKTNDVASLSGNHKTAYYSLGNKGNSVDYAITKSIVGVPFSSGEVNLTLKGAGANIDFGTNGNRRNYWGETYNSYVRDAFAYTDGKDWSNGYGKNLYQLGNPFLTNLDLSKISEVAKAKIRGIRVEVTETQYAADKGTTYGTYKYVTFSSTGIPTGDVSAAIVRPMQTFLIKTNDDSGVDIDFAALRTFDYTPSNKTNLKVQSLSTPKSGLKTLSSSSTTLSSSVKQLGLIALDENQNEIGRTYYVVYPEAITGKPSGQATTQAQATRNDVIGTFEEKADGGYDAEAAKSYWLYINDANENDFKGKNILLKKNNADVKFLKFEIRQDTNLLREGESKLLGGESFYIESMSGSDLVKATHGEIIPATENYYNLYYGLPENRTLETIEVNRPADCVIVYDEAIKSYKLIFDSTWSSANIKIFDISGKLIGSANGVSTSQAYSIYLPTGVQSTYVVVAQSEKGEVFSQKIVTKN